MILCTPAHFLMHIWRKLLRQFGCCIFGAFSTPARKAEHSVYVCSVSVRLFSPPASAIGRASSARPGANICDACSAFTQGNALQRQGVCCAHMGGDNWEIVAGNTWGADAARRRVSPHTIYTRHGLHTPGRHTHTHLPTTRWRGEDCKCDLVDPFIFFTTSKTFHVRQLRYYYHHCALASNTTMAESELEDSGPLEPQLLPRPCLLFRKGWLSHWVYQC